MSTVDSRVFADLHTHSTASDGMQAPSVVIEAAHAAGLGAIALTDHDTTDGIPEAQEAAAGRLEVIPGIEMSSNVGEAEVHILGYFIDPSHPDLIDALASFQRMRVVRVERFTARLAELGMPVSLERVRAIAGAGSIGRPHVARAMVEAGYVQSVAEAFDLYLAGGRPAFIPRDDTTPEQCVQLIRHAGGISTLAHPFTTGDPDGFARILKLVGLLGLEVEYAKYPPEHRAQLRAIADRYGLILTGGSDYHGPEHRSEVRLGGGGVSSEIVERLRSMARA